LTVRFLVDAQLPPALARWLEAKGHEAQHVFDLGLMEASDRAIWAKAGEIGFTLVTKDEDFVTLLATRPNGASVVWLRVGNTTRPALLEWFGKVLPEIESALGSGESLIEVI
jgi:predicted nuclease of predicted toxin-antitoxin system